MWGDNVKRNGTLESKQARDVVYESSFFSVVDDKHFSQTVAEAWVVLQVEYRYETGIHVDYKAAKASGGKLP